MKLMYGTTCVASWIAHGDGYVAVTKTIPVTKVRTYTLIVEPRINGMLQPSASVTGTC